MNNEFKPNTDYFGWYAKISTDYSGAKHLYKIVTVFASNSYNDVPITVHNREPKLHDDVIPVFNVIHCGIKEDTVLRVAVKDCELINPLKLRDCCPLCGTKNKEQELCN